MMLHTIVLLVASFLGVPGPIGGEPPAAVSPADVTHYSPALFAEPPGCDAYAWADPASGVAYWGGCNTNGCPEGTGDCQVVIAGGGYHLSCECGGGEGGKAACYACFGLAADQETIESFWCHDIACVPIGCATRTGVPGGGNFYSCRCGGW